MLAYTIGYIRQGDSILLLNREKPSWMGMWNGVGGKIDTGEHPLDGIIREIREETGLSDLDVTPTGTITWSSQGGPIGGMYTFVAYLPEAQPYETPHGTREGILDWKTLDWIQHPQNQGVATYIPYCLPRLLDTRTPLHFHCIYEDKRLVHVEERAVPATL